MEETNYDVRKAHAVRPGEIVIEIDNEHVDLKIDDVADSIDPFNPLKMKRIRREVRCGNRHELFAPHETRKNGTNFVRSRIELVREGTRVRHTMDPALDSIESIPGERIHIDLNTKIGRITDGIVDPDNNDEYFKLIHAAKNMQRKFILVPGEYFEVDMSKDDVAFWKWVFAMRQIADGDREHSSGPPAHPGCALKGPRRCRPVQNIDMLPSRIECVRSGKLWIETHGQTKEWEDHQKMQDPNFKPMRDNGQVLLTPFLAGLPETESVGV